MRRQFGGGVDRLQAVGAAHPGRPLSIIPSPACYEGHSAEVDYDTLSMRSSIFCPEAGRVRLEDAQLHSLQLDTNWLPEQLSVALGVASSPPRRTLIEGARWLLGDTTFGSTEISVALAIGIRGTDEFYELIEGLQKRQPFDVGLLLVAPEQLPDRVLAVTGYRAVALTDVASLAGNTIKVSQTRLGAWIKTPLHRRSPPRSGHAGRPSVRDQISFVFEARRHRGEPYVSKASEALAIQSEWYSLSLDEDLLAHSTIRKHLPSS